MAAPIDQGQVLALKTERSEGLEIGEAARLLGTGRTQARQLIRRGLLGAAPEAGALQRLFRTDVDALLARLEALARPGKPLPDLRPLQAVCKAKRIRLAAACSAALNGRLTISGTDPSAVGLRRVLVRPDDVEEPPRKGMTIEDVSVVLRLHPEATSWLVRQGILAAVADGRGMRVLATSIDAFKVRFVRCAGLAKERGTSPKALAADLARRGLLPAFGPPHCRQVLFARAEVEALLRQCETEAAQRKAHGNDRG